jgi:glycosyltransferase involved in cell wall biosynthesis
MNMVKKISWVTPTWFIDVDILIVPKLSENYLIDWTIIGKDCPNAFSILKRKENGQLTVKFIEMKSKWYLPSSFYEYVNFFKRIVSEKADIIYIDFAPQLYAYYASVITLPKHKTVFATHNVKTPKGAKLEMVSRYYMKRLLRKYNNFQVFSKNQLDYLQQQVKNKNVLYAPLALKEYGVKVERSRHLNCVNFLSFGHIRHYKRIDLLIDASQQLYEETGVKFVVTIAGNCPGWNEYAKKICYAELFDLQIGYVDDSQVAGLFSNADFLVLPYQDLAQSGAITVAFNYGVPVITSDIPQFQEFVENGKNGFLFQSENVSSLKQVMLKVLEMPRSEYAALLKSVEAYVSDNYSLQAITNRYVDYFNRLK